MNSVLSTEGSHEDFSMNHCVCQGGTGYFMNSVLSTEGSHADFSMNHCVCQGGIGFFMNSVLKKDTLIYYDSI